MIRLSKSFIAITFNPNIPRFCNYLPKSFLSTVSNNILNTDDFLEPLEYDSFEFEKVPHKKRTISKLQELFNCSQENALDIMKQVPNLVKRSISNINEIISICDNKRIGHDILYNNPWILGIKNDDLKTRIELLETIKYQDFEDFVPFLQLSTKELQHLTRIMHCESEIVPGGNRLYYFKNMTKVKTPIISQCFASRWFIYEVQFLYFRHILKFLLDSGVTPMNILRDLWVFKYHPSKVRERITVARRAKSKKVMPWMVRCQNKVFERFINRTNETNTLLANRSVEDYLAEKLQCDVDLVEYIVSTNPSIKKIHITKIQDTLDYLMNQGFNAYHIAQAPRILSHSLKTTMERIEEIKNLGLTTNSLIILCKSKKEYLKHLKVLERSQFSKATKQLNKVE